MKKLKKFFTSILMLSIFINMSSSFVFAWDYSKVYNTPENSIMRLHNIKLQIEEINCSLNPNLEKLINAIDKTIEKLFDIKLYGPPSDFLVLQLDLQNLLIFLKNSVKTNQTENCFFDLWEFDISLPGYSVKVNKTDVNKYSFDMREINMREIEIQPIVKDVNDKATLQNENLTIEINNILSFEKSRISVQETDKKIRTNSLTFDLDNLINLLTNQKTHSEFEKSRISVQETNEKIRTNSLTFDLDNLINLSTNQKTHSELEKIKSSFNNQVACLKNGDGPGYELFIYYGLSDKLVVLLKNLIATNNNIQIQSKIDEIESTEYEDDIVLIVNKIHELCKNLENEIKFQNEKSKQSLPQNQTFLNSKVSTITSLILPEELDILDPAICKEVIRKLKMIVLKLDPSIIKQLETLKYNYLDNSVMLLKTAISALLSGIYINKDSNYNIQMIECDIQHIYNLLTESNPNTISLYSQIFQIDPKRLLYNPNEVLRYLAAVLPNE